MEQWTRELHTWAPEYRVCMWDGAASVTTRHHKSREDVLKTVIESGSIFLCVLRLALIITLLRWHLNHDIREFSHPM